MGKGNYGKVVEVWNLETLQQVKNVNFTKNVWFENYYQLKDGRVFFGNSNGFMVLDEKTFELSQGRGTLFGKTSAWTLGTT